jgi:hypothetical protein
LPLGPELNSAEDADTDFNHLEDEVNKQRALLPILSLAVLAILPL